MPSESSSPLASAATKSPMSGRNSCRGGSSSRTVTGRPSIASRIPSKSACWAVASCSRASVSASVVSARIMARTRGSRSELKNMCSVRQSPIPIAPAFRAATASSAVSALALTARVSDAISSAQARIESSSGGTTDLTTSRPPRVTEPVEPSIEIMSPSDTTTSPTRKWSSATSTWSAPQTQGVPQPRATTAAWLTRPPWEVSMPSTTAMAATSSGDVSRRTRITCSPRSTASMAPSVVM